MCKDKNSGDSGAVKRKMPKGVQFTPMNAKQAQEASVRARNMRKQVRAQMLDTLVNNMDFGAEMLKAIKSGDIDQVNLLQTAMKVVGLTHDQSEDAVHKLDIKTDNKTELSGSIEFVLPEKK